MDDPNGELLPERITQKELAARTPSQPVYVLENVPEGFVQEITVPSNRSNGSSLNYVLAYRNLAGGYITIQTRMLLLQEARFENTLETYTTVAGLKVFFLKESTDREQYVYAIAQSPDGAAIVLESSLPSDQIEALAEGLILLE